MPKPCLGYPGSRCPVNIALSEYQDFQMNQMLGDRMDDTVETYFYSILELKNTFLCCATQGDDCELGFPDYTMEGEAVG